jgi:3-deoxy-D-manno-octulosonic-acid transferase
MNRLWEVLYSWIFIPFFGAVLKTLGLFDAKVRRGIAGRKGLFEDLAAQISRVPPGIRVWFHSSSMGEFEQAKPIIAALKQRYPDVRIIVTFFSPSGYEHSRSYKLADVITYLPFDSVSGARRYVELVKPDVAVMVRYDIWPNHIWELHRRNIPILIANATMSRRTLRRLPILRSFHRHVYGSIDEILTVSEGDVEAFRFLVPHHPKIEVIGDTRFDQVSIRSAEARKRNIIPPHILQNKKVLAVGSSWPEDEEVVLPSFLQLQAEHPDFLLILVPHEPTVEHIENIEQQLAGQTDVLRFSALNEYNGERVILVDSIGILLILYASAHIAYVGGSFRQGIHNVLEAAVYGIPVLFGPKHRNSHEPLLLLERGGGFVINDSRELSRLLENLLTDEAARTTAGERAAKFVASNIGATEHFLTRLEPYLAKTSSHTSRS